jgi:ribonuclease HII
MKHSVILIDMNYIIGIDEVGRGPVAGPVVVCACAVLSGVGLTHLYPQEKLRDSKKLSKKQRKAILHALESFTQSQQVLFGIGESSVEMIDNEGIVPAIKAATQQALLELERQGVGQESYVYLDGALSLPDTYAYEVIIKGDEKILEISLASIYAKEYRDTMMCEYAKKYGEYGFETNVGYGTSAHYKAITQYGITPLHRKSFLKMK